MCECSVALGRCAEEPHAAAHQLIVCERAGHVAARVRERAQQLGGHRRIGRIRVPDLVDERAQPLQVVHLGQFPDLHAARPGRGLRAPASPHRAAGAGGLCGGAVSSVMSSSSATRAASSAARCGMTAAVTCSWSACGPPPTAPRPSRVGVPTPAVRFPSDAPPTATPRSGSSPSRPATRWAVANRSADAAGSIGGQVGPGAAITAGAGQHRGDQPQGLHRPAAARRRWPPARPRTASPGPGPRSPRCRSAAASA